MIVWDELILNACRVVRPKIICFDKMMPKFTPKHLIGWFMQAFEYLYGVEITLVHPKHAKDLSNPREPPTKTIAGGFTGFCAGIRFSEFEIH